MDSTKFEVKIPKRILNTLLSSLSAGVVPRIGAPYIAIGREEEIGSLIENLEATADGGAACRIIVGRYGSGKSFLIQLVRGRALERGFICLDADLSPERRLTGGSGAGVATYRELVSNMATKACPDGGALPTVLSRYYAKLRTELLSENIDESLPRFEQEIKKRVGELLSRIEGDVGGFDFARVLGEYYSATIRENDEKKNACLRWLRGEFSTKTEANAALGFKVSIIIDDDNWYNFIKLFASLSAELGYSGLAVFIDECVNLFKIPNRISREANYEKLLAIFNDTLQGRAKHLAVIFGGTPAFLEDTRRGLFSYEALKSRLEDSKYFSLGYRNLSSPVIRLRALSDNELVALVCRLSNLYSMQQGIPPLVSDGECAQFIKTAKSRPGAEEMITPREIIRDFLSLLSILKDNKDASFSSLSKELKFSEKGNSDNEDAHSLPCGTDAASKADDASIQKINLFDIDI